MEDEIEINIQNKASNTRASKKKQCIYIEIDKISHNNITVKIGSITKKNTHC